MNDVLFYFSLSYLIIQARQLIRTLSPFRFRQWPKAFVQGVFSCGTCLSAWVTLLATRDIVITAMVSAAMGFYQRVIYS